MTWITNLKSAMAIKKIDGYSLVAFQVVDGQRMYGNPLI